MTKADKEVATAGASAAPVVTSASPTGSVSIVEAPEHALVRAQLSDYLDGPIDTGLRQRIDAHLAGCSHCAAYLATLRSTVQVLDRLPAPKAPAAGIGRALEEARRLRDAGPAPADSLDA